MALSGLRRPCIVVVTYKPKSGKRVFFVDEPEGCDLSVMSYETCALLLAKRTKRSVLVNPVDFVFKPHLHFDIIVTSLDIAYSIRAGDLHIEVALPSGVKFSSRARLGRALVERALRYYCRRFIKSGEQAEKMPKICQKILAECREVQHREEKSGEGMLFGVVIIERLR